ncbi:MAG: drug/metabolite transporter (DMT)-like permease [Alphaproteobacteria bacterium]|jgi:drug/metabolite transporter (DMT)-like permease
MTGKQIDFRMTPAVWAMLVLLSVVWGGTFFFQEIAVRELPVFTIVAVRVILAAAILLIVVALSGERLPREWKIWRALFLLALINNVIPFCLIVWGQKEIASGLAAILNATTPIFTVLVAHYATTDEKITGAKLIGVLAGFIGVAIVLGIDLLDGLGTAVIAQLAALAYGIGAIFGRKFRAMGVSANVTATGQLMASCVVLIPMALVVDAPWSLPVPSTGTIFSLIGLGSVSTALAYILYFHILEKAGATNLVLVTFLIPVSALGLGIFILGEVLLIQHVVGLLCIGVGLAALDGRLLKRWW